MRSCQSNSLKVLN